MVTVSLRRLIAAFRKSRSGLATHESAYADIERAMQPYSGDEEVENW